MKAYIERKLSQNWEHKDNRTLTPLAEIGRLGGRSKMATDKTDFDIYTTEPSARHDLNI